MSNRNRCRTEKCLVFGVCVVVTAVVMQRLALSSTRIRFLFCPKLTTATVVLHAANDTSVHAEHLNTYC